MRPFLVEIPQEQLDDLHRRLADARWPAEPADLGWARGVPSAYLKELADYWRTEYDWRAAEARLNSYPQFVTQINGADVYFMHVRSPEPDARPLLISHGWPGSVVEFQDIIGPLTDPRSHGGDPADAFHLVIPSIPGFGFSGPLNTTGWGTHQVAEAWAELMRRLGYDRYFAQGGDAGSVISLDLGRTDPDHVAGVHVNMLLTFPSGNPAELEGLSEQDMARLGQLSRFDTELSAYMKLQSTRPQTLAYGLTDSPVGQLAWIVEKFREWTDSSKVPEDAISRDQMLTIVSIYWLTATAGSSATLYYEDADMLRKIGAGEVPPPPPVPVPVGVAVFPRDILLPIRRIAERDLANITRWTEFDRGGHFAAMEQPDLLVSDIREFARPLR
jgi:pimeloyl-ACP methyl ester carboxylesterase